MTADAITDAVLERHGLTREEYQRILEMMGRQPTITELGIFSVMWSEHCSYKSSRVHLRTLPTTGRRVLQGPGENAGAVDIGDGLAADRGHAGAVAVAADAGHHPGHQVAGARVGRVAEAQRIHIGDGPRPHGEHVAHDAADAGRGSLVRLDIGGMVVALHLEHGRLSVAEIDDAGILPWALDDLRA